MKYIKNEQGNGSQATPNNKITKEKTMKIYKIKKVKNGFKVVWYWENSFTESEFEIENGFFETLSEADNFAWELELNQ